jgi:2-polyprenyl-6-methoxyphenol hydroxylase-like FAD-dependent oxidoreductase
METEVTNIVVENGRVLGVKVQTADGLSEVRAELVVGADGGGSTVRKRAGLEVVDLRAPIDVLWFRLSKKVSDPAQAFGFVEAGQFMVLIDRADYWQCRRPQDSFIVTTKHFLGYSGAAERYLSLEPPQRVRHGVNDGDWS